MVTVLGKPILDTFWPPFQEKEQSQRRAPVRPSFDEIPEGCPQENRTNRLQKDDKCNCQVCDADKRQHRLGKVWSEPQGLEILDPPELPLQGKHAVAEEFSRHRHAQNPFNEFAILHTI